MNYQDHTRMNYQDHTISVYRDDSSVDGWRTACTCRYEFPRKHYLEDFAWERGVKHLMYERKLDVTSKDVANNTA